MAIIRNLRNQPLQRESKHTEVEATYSFIDTEDGRFLQIDTYGSARRRFQGKKSQSIRFSPAAIRQLKNII